MTRRGVINRFGIEELEHRVLLSGTLSGVAAAAVAGSGHGHQEVLQAQPAAVESQPNQEAFAGMGHGDAVVQALPSVNQAEGAPAGENPVTPPTAPTNLSDQPSPSSTVHTLVTTLRVANAPPGNIHALAVPDLNQSILAELALYQSGTISGTQVVSSTEGTIGPIGAILDIQSPVITFTGVHYQGGVFQSGLVTIAGSSASLNFGSSLNPSNGPVTGSYSIGTGAFDTHFQLGTLQATFSVTGGNSPSLNLDDTTDTGAQSATLTGSTLTGLGLGVGGITYGSLAALSINLGSGNVTFTVNGVNSPTTIYGGSGLDTFVVNANNASNGQSTLLASLTINGQITSFPGDTLTINGIAGGDNFVVNGFSVMGAGATISYQTLQGLIINGIGGSNTFQVDGTSIPTTLNGGPNSNLFTVNNSIASLTLNGGGGANSFLIQGNSGPLNAFGDGGSGTFTVNANSAKMTLTGGAAGNSFTVNGNSASLSLIGGGGGDAFTVNGTNSALSILGGSGSSVFNLNAQLGAVVTVQGGTGPSSALIVSGLANNTIAISNSSISASASPINYSGVTSVTVNGGLADTFVLSSAGVPTTINGGAGNDTFDVRGISAPTILNTGAGVNTVNVGSSAPFTLGTLSLIASNLTVNGGGADSLNIDDTGATASVTGTLTAVTTLTGLGMGPGDSISYNGVAAMNISLGSGGNNFTIAGTNSASTSLNTGYGNDTINVQAIGGPTTINTGSGTNTVIVGNSANQVSSILGLLTVNGNGSDSLSVNDTGTSLNRFGTLTSTAVTGLGMGPIDPSAVAYQVQFSGDLQTWSILGAVSSSAAQVNWTDPQPNGPAGFYRIVEFLPGGDEIAINPTLNLVNGHISLAWANGANTQSPPAPGGIQYSGLSALTVSLGGGGDSFTIASTNSGTLTTINGGGGNGTINLAGNSSPLNLLTQGLSSTVNVENSSAPITVTLGAANNTVNVQSTGASLGVIAGSGINIVNVGSLEPLNGGLLDAIQGSVTVTGANKTTLNVDDSGNSAGKTGLLTSGTLSGLNMAGISYTGLTALNLGLGLGGNTLTVASTAGGIPTSVNSGPGNDTVNIQGTTGLLNFNTGGGTNTVNVGSTAPGGPGNLIGIQGMVSLNGNGADTINVDDSGDGTGRNGTLTASALIGLSNAAINYAGASFLNLNLGSATNTVTINSTNGLTITTVNGGDAADTFNIVSTSGALKLNSRGGDDTINVRSTGGATNVTTGAGVNTLNIGTQAPSGNGNVDGIHGTLGLTGSGADILNIDDTSTLAIKSGTLTSTTLNDLGMAGVTYAGFARININLGAGDTFNIRSTGSPVFVNTGGGANTINLSSSSPGSGGDVNGIINPVSLVGTGTGTLNIDDAGSAQAKIVTLNGSTISGLAPSPISYSGLALLNINFGSGGNSLTVAATNSKASTTLNTGTGSDTVTILSSASSLAVSTGGGDDLVNVQGVGAPANIDTGTGTNTLNIGDAAGTVDEIVGLLSLTGHGLDTLNVDDTGSKGAKSGTLTSSVLGISTASINYVGMAKLNIRLGSGGNAFTVGSTNTSTTTTLNSGDGNDTVGVSSLSGVLFLNTQSGDDVVNVQSTGASLNLNTGTGTNVVNVGSLSPLENGNLNGILGLITVTGGGADVLRIDDTGSSAGKNGTLTNLSVTGLSPATISYTGLATLNINLGSGSDTFLVASDNNLTNIDTGAGDDTLNVQTTVAPLKLATGLGLNTVNIASVPQNVVDGIQGTVSVTGNGTDRLNIFDTGSNSPKSETLTGLDLNISGSAAITYSGIAALNISLGSGRNTASITSTAANTVTTVNSGAGIDKVDIFGTSGVLNVNSQDSDDVINVHAVGAPVLINTGTGKNIINAGSGGVSSIVDGINAPLTIQGSGTDTLNVDDSGSPGATGKTGNLTAGTLTGLGMVNGINYVGLVALNISLGLGDDTFTVAATNSQTVTSLNAGGGSDTINVRGIAAPTNIDTGAGTNTINIGDTAGGTGLGKVDGIQGILTIIGHGNDALNLDDRRNSIAKTGTLTGSVLDLSIPGAVGTAEIRYSGLAALNMGLGSGGNSFNINSTNVQTITTLNSGTGDDTVNILNTSGTTNVNTQTGLDIINIQGNGGVLNVDTRPGTGTVHIGNQGNLNGIQGVVNLIGSKTDTLSIDDSGSAGPKSGTLSGSAFTLQSTQSGSGVVVINYTDVGFLNISLGFGGNNFTISGTNAGTVTTLNSGNGADTVTVQNTGGTTNVNGGGSDDVINIQGTGASGPLQVDTGVGSNTINVGSTAGSNVAGIVDGIQGALTLAGNGNDILNVDDTANGVAKVGVMTSLKLSGLAPAEISYASLKLALIKVGLGSGANIFNIVSTTAITNLKGGIGNETINVQSTGAVVSVSTGGGINTVNVGSQAPNGGGNVDGIQGDLMVTGNGADTLNVDDTGTALAKTGSLTSAALTGLSHGTIGYGGLTALNINLGSKGNGFTILSTNTKVNLNSGLGADVVNVQGTGAGLAVVTGGGINTVNVGSNAPSNAGGILDGVQGVLTLTGSGNDTLNIDDTGSGGDKIGTLTAANVTDTGMAGIGYVGVGKLNISLGNGHNAFTIGSTASGTVSTLNSGLNSVTDAVTVQGTGGVTVIYAQARNETVLVKGSGGVLTINAGTGVDTINLQGIGASATINNTLSGVTTINVGSLAPGINGIVDGLQGALTVNGNGHDVLNVDDTGSGALKTDGILTGATITGLGTSGITYSGLSALNISLGSGGDTFNIADTSVATTVNGGSGSDTFIITTTSAPTILNTKGGNDTVTVRNTGNVTTINPGNGTDTVNVRGTSALTTVNNASGTTTINVGSLAVPPVGGNVESIHGLLTVSGSGQDILNVDDTGGTVAKGDGNLTGSALTGLGMAGINYTGVASLNINLGTHGNTFAVAGTNVQTITTLNSGTGDDTVNILNTSGTTNVNTQSGHDIINIQGNGGVLNVDTRPGTGTVHIGNQGNLNGIQGVVNLIGSKTDTLSIDDSGSAGPKSGTLSGSAFTLQSTQSGSGVVVINYTDVGFLNISLGFGGNNFTISGTNAGTVTTLNSGNGADTVTVQNTGGTTNVNGGGSDDVINIQGTGASGPLQVDTGVGSNTINVGSTAGSNVAGIVDGIQGALTLAGNGNDILNVDDTANGVAKVGTMTSLKLSGLAPAEISYASLKLALIKVGLGSGANIFNIVSTTAITNLKGGIGNETINVQSTGAAVSVSTGGGINTVNVGSQAPSSGGNVDGIQGDLMVTGNGADTLNVDDTGTALAKTGSLTSAALTGLSHGTIGYGGLTALNINLGSKGNGFTILSTNTKVNLNSGLGADVVNVQGTGAGLAVVTGGGINTVNVGSNAPSNAGGILDGVQGVLTLTGSGNDTLNIDDTGSGGDKIGTLTAANVTDTGMAGIGYVGVGKLNISLGNGHNAFTIGSTASGTVSTLNSGLNSVTDAVTVQGTGGVTVIYAQARNETVLVKGSGGVLTINAGTGVDTINLQGIGASATINNTLSGVTTINVGSSAPGINGIVDGLKGALTVNGNGHDVLNVDDTGSGALKTDGILTGATITGLGTSGITYSGLSALNISLGSGGDTFNIADTSVATTVNGGSGADTFIITTTSAPTILNTKGGNDTVTVRNTGNVTTINPGNGTDTVNVRGTSALTTVNNASGTTTINVGSLAVPPVGGNVESIHGLLTVSGSGQDILNVDDTGGTVAKGDGNLTGSALTGLGMAGINYTGVASLNINLGTHGNTFAVAGTNIQTITTLNSGTGDDTVNVLATGGSTTVNAGLGVDTINIGSNTPAIVNNIAGVLVVTGSGNDTLNVNDTGTIGSKLDGNLTSLALTGLGMAGISYSGLSTLNINLGSGADTFLVTGTPSGAVTTVKAGPSNDILNVKGTNGPTTINSAGGVNTINVGLGTIGGIQGALTVIGSNADTLNIDDSASNTSGQVETLNGTVMTSAGMAGITYSGISGLNLNLDAGGNLLTVTGTHSGTPTTINSGGGNDTVNIRSTSSPTTVNTGVGANTVNVGSLASAVGGVLNNISNLLTVTGGGLDTLNLDDTGSGVAKSGTVTSSSVTGFGLGAGVNYSGVAALNLSLGSGDDSVTIGSTNGGTATTVQSGPGNDTVNVLATTGPATINTGGGVNTINVGSKAPTTGGIVDNLKGVLMVNGNGGDTMNVDDTGSTGAKSGSLTSSTITGLGMGSSGIGYSGLSVLNINLGTGKNTFGISGINPGTATTVNGGPNSGNTLSIALSAIFSGSLTVSGFPNISSITVNGNFGGTLTLGVGTNIVSMSVTGNFTGQILSQGTVTLLAISGNAPGLISAGAIGTITVGQGIGPVALSVREGTLQRQVEVTGGTAVMNLYYQSVASGFAVPQVAIRVTNGTPATLYDVNLAIYNVVGGAIVSRSSLGKFNLSLIYAVVVSGLNPTGLSGVYNLVIDGDLLTTVSSGAKAYFGLLNGAVGGVQLPKDAMGGVAIRDLAAPNSVNVKTLQALAFGQYQEEDGGIHGGNTAEEEDAEEIVVSSLGIAAANGTYRVTFGSANGVALFIGQSVGQFENNPVIFTDQYTDGAAVQATVKVVSGNPPQVSTIVLSGDGGSIQTQLTIGQSITSGGALGDLNLNQNNVALNVTAPSIFGNIDLDGAITGIIQTTGKRTDAISGVVTTVSGDMGGTYSYSTGHGTVVAATSITSEGTMTGQLIARGNLVSQINLYLGMSGGVIAAKGDMGAQVGGARVGGLFTNGGPGTGGSLVVLGNVLGDIWINGGMKGLRIAVSGNDSGNLSISGGMDAGSVVAVRGSIGSVSSGTYFYLDNLKGILAVEGTVNFGRSFDASQAQFNKTSMGSGNANSNALDAIFTSGGQTLAFDMTGLDLLGLASIRTDLSALHVVSGSLTGTTP